MMNVVITHGYLLRGTGSNLYVSNLARAFCKLGHNVTIFCQESSLDGLDYIGDYFKYNPSNSQMIKINENNEENMNISTKATLIQPDISDLLPVYVYDEYENFTVKEFTELSTEELEAYITSNKEALANFFANNKADLVISNHTIMQPVYTSRALEKSYIKKPPKHFMVVHGSSLNFSVKNKQLLKEYAVEGIKKVDGCIFVSNHSKEDFYEYFSDLPDLSEKLHMIPAGVNTEGFLPLCSQSEKYSKINRLKELLDQKEINGMDKINRGRTLEDQKDYLSKIIYERSCEEWIRNNLKEIRERFDNWSPDRDQDRKIDMIDWEKDDVVLFFGKYLWTKGVQLILAASPLILLKNPNAKFIFVGFGSSREIFEALAYALDTNNEHIYESILKRSESMDPEGGGPAYNYFQGLFDKLNENDFREKYYNCAKNNIFERTIFTGIMDHKKLQNLIPVVDLTVAPSIFPEAFGMIAVESLASGVIPLVTNHSGFKDVKKIYTRELKKSSILKKHDEIMKKLSPLNLNSQIVFNLANNTNLLLDLNRKLTSEERIELGQQAHEIAAKNFSWDKIAKGYLQLL